MNIYNTPRVIAHRGGGSVGPENTVEGIHKMVSIGVRGVEVDVQLTADGVPVMHHNAKLRDGRRIADMNSGDLPYDTTLLVDALRYCAVTETWIDVEVKFDRAPKETEAAAHARAVATGRMVASLVAQYSPRPCMNNMVSSFNSSVLTGALQSAGDRIMVAGIMYDPVGDLPNNIVLPIEMSKHKGFEEYARQCNVWLWSNAESMYKTSADAMFRAGVIGIITDRPDML